MTPAGLEPAAFGLGIQGQDSLTYSGLSGVLEIGPFCPDSASQVSLTSLPYSAFGQSTGKADESGR